MSLKFVVIGFVILFLLGFTGLNLLAYRHAKAMMHFSLGGDRTAKPEKLGLWQKMTILISGVNLPRPAGEAEPADFAKDCHQVKISVTETIHLSAWYCDQGTDTPLVALFHGYGTDKTSLLDEGRAFLELGCSVMLVDFRGSGGSSESYATIGWLEADDVAAVVGYIRSTMPHNRLICFGQSMGAVAILKAISQHGIQPDAIILEAVFDTLLNTIRNRFRIMGVPSFPSAHLLAFWGGKQWGFDGFSHNPIDYAADVKCPALVMHGQEDPRAKLIEGRRVFNAISAQKQFVVFEKTGHESYIATDPIAWQKAVESFVR